MNRLVVLALALVVLVVSGAVIIQQAFSQNEGPTVVPTVVVPTPANADAPTIDPGGTVTIVDVEPTTLPTQTGVDMPTAEPTAEPPDPAPVPAGETVLERYTFDADAALTGWEFSHVKTEGEVAAPPWDMEGDALEATRNPNALWGYNDLLAIAPATVETPGAVEATALARYDSKIGVLLGYADEQNYVALVLGTQDAPPNPSGLTLMQMVDGDRVILAQDESTFAAENRWYTLRLDIDGTSVSAIVDGTPLLTASLSEPLTGDRAGLYAGSEGDASFTDMIIFGE
jgi:hypothetical protein